MDKPSNIDQQTWDELMEEYEGAILFTGFEEALVGFGYQHDLDAIFVRAEASYLEFDGATVNSSNSDNKASIKNLDGVTAKISIGKTF